MSGKPLFVEVGHAQERKRGELVCGDVFTSTRIEAEDRVLAVLSDGLGSGVKANILASMTARMAIRFAAAERDCREAAAVIASSLPICRERGIGYATMTVLDCGLDGSIRVVENGNPPFLLVRGDGATVEIPRCRLSENADAVELSEFECAAGDRLLVVSDGVTQAGMGSPRHPDGWKIDGLRQHVAKLLAGNHNLAARVLARAVISEVRHRDGGEFHDDTSCVVLHFRWPRRLMVATGPPFDQTRDAEMAARLRSFDGAKVVCGGTTAKIVARELGVQLATDGRGAAPAALAIPGIDLATEGLVTMSKALKLLEDNPVSLPASDAGTLAGTMLDSDDIEFWVGTRVNEAHHDPRLPFELGIRRDIVGKIAALLRSRHLKKVTVSHI